MAESLLPSPEQLRQLLRYEPETGKLFWLPRDVSLFRARYRTVGHACRCWNTRHAGREAFTTISNQGYRIGTLSGARHRAHRVIWALVNGEWPKDQVDHVNGDKTDNRLLNLRVVTRRENLQNAKRYTSNTSGVVGVCWHKRQARWVARIKIDGQYIALGSFPDFNEAASARKAAETSYGFHANHGRA